MIAIVDIIFVPALATMPDAIFEIEIRYESSTSVAVADEYLSTSSQTHGRMDSVRYPSGFV